MKEKQISHEEARQAVERLRLKSVLGDYILLFGSVETVLVMFITHISKTRFHVQEIDKYEMFMERIFSKYNSFNSNVEIAEYLIDIYSEDKSKEKWEEVINELKYAMIRRNFYAHNMHQLRDDKSFAKLKVSRSNKAENYYVDVTAGEIESDYFKLAKVYKIILLFFMSETNPDGTPLSDLKNELKIPIDRE